MCMLSREKFILENMLENNVYGRYATFFKNHELKETVELMNSVDYKDRFIAEYHQVKIRYEKLKNFCNKIEVETMLGKEVTKHDCPLELLREQQKYMGLYLSVLEKRALIENVEL